MTVTPDKKELKDILKIFIENNYNSILENPLETALESLPPEKAEIFAKHIEIYKRLPEKIFVQTLKSSPIIFNQYFSQIEREIILEKYYKEENFTEEYTKFLEEIEKTKANHNNKYIRSRNRKNPHYTPHISYCFIKIRKKIRQKIHVLDNNRSKPAPGNQTKVNQRSRTKRKISGNNRGKRRVKIENRTLEILHIIKGQNAKNPEHRRHGKKNKKKTNANKPYTRRSLLSQNNNLNNNQSIQNTKIPTEKRKGSRLRNANDSNPGIKRHRRCSILRKPKQKRTPKTKRFYGDPKTLILLSTTGALFPEKIELNEDGIR